MSNKKHETETTFGHGKEAEASQADRHAPEAVASQSQTAPETTSGHENKAKSGSNKKTREILSVQYLRTSLAHNLKQVALLSFLPR